MKIYTRQGDSGETSLASGERVSKASARVESYGAVDELNSFIGLLRAHVPRKLEPELTPVLQKIQSELFNVGNSLASHDQSRACETDSFLPAHLESEMDRMTNPLPPLKNFILPAGTIAASTAHVCRSVCRRAERICVALNQNEGIDSKIIIFLNRLSDYFFVLARYLNHKEDYPEVIWKP